MLKRYLVIVAVICLGVKAAAFDVRQIVVPDNPAAVEKYAAELLANYLEKVFNRRFPIVRSSVLPSKGSCCVGPFFAEKGSMSKTVPRAITARKPRAISLVTPRGRRADLFILRSPDLPSELPLRFLCTPWVWSFHRR